MGTTTVENNTKTPQRLKWNYHTMQQSPWACGHRKGKISKSYLYYHYYVHIHIMYNKPRYRKRKEFKRKEFMKWPRALC